MRFSVVIPLFYKAPYVRKALESAIGQTFTDYEIVVVDDLALSLEKTYTFQSM